MSPNGLRRWRRYAKKCRYRSRKEGKVSNATGASLRALFFAARIHPNYAVPPKPFTSRSIVGMTMGARKRAARLQYMLHTYEIGPIRREVLSVFAPCDAASHTYKRAWRMYRIGQRLRPCPGCCACWGHRISSAYGEIAECCGPQTSGKRKSQIKAMRKWQETLADNCDGSGVLPARRSK